MLRGKLMDPIEILHDRIIELEKKIDTNTKDLYKKMDLYFTRLSNEINELSKFKWKIMGGAGFAGFLLYGIFEIALTLFQKTGGL